MSNTVVKINGSHAVLPTVLGQGPARIPTGGKIRAGIKVLTSKAAAYPDAHAIYARGMAVGDSFAQIEKALAVALPQLKTPLFWHERGSRPPCTGRYPWGGIEGLRAQRSTS